MTDEETVQTQLSAHLVEEGYVTLQERMRTYRQAKNQGNQAAGLAPDADPTIVLQDAVETFFSLVRPYIEGEPRLAEYWHGALAQYPDSPHRSQQQALAYYKENSVGVWQTQEHTRAVSAQQNAASSGSATAEAATDGGNVEPADLHDALNLPNTVRILVVEPAFDDESFEGWYYVEGRFAVLGLRELKDWQVRERTQRDRGAGFMAGETSTQTVREPEPAAKVETAAEMLVDVADELGAIASYEPSGERVHGTPVPDS